MNPHVIKNLRLALFVGLCLVTRPGDAEETKSVTNLKGEVVIVPDDIPDRQTFNLLGMQRIAVETQAGSRGLILLIYNNPKSQGLGNYVETYDLAGNLLEITWADKEGQVKVAQDKNLTDPDAKELAKVLVMDMGYKPSVDERPARLHF